MQEKTKSLSKGGIFYLIYNILNIIFPFLTGIYVARILLPSNIGEVAAAQNLATYFVIFAFLGLPTYGVREVSKVRFDKKQLDCLFSELFIINFISTSLFSVIYIGVINIVSAYREHLDLYLVVGISVAINVFNISWLFEGLEEFRFISLRNLFFKIISFVLLVIFVKTPNDYLVYAGITVFGTLGNNIINMIYAPQYASFDFKNINLKRHMKSIFFLVAVNLAIEIYSLMDVTMMNFWCEKENIAFYKYGGGIERILLQVVNTFTVVIVPRMSLYYKEKRIADFNMLISKGMKMIIIAAVPMIIGIYFTADFLIIHLYGIQYASSAIILKMLSVLIIISPIGYLLGSRVMLVTDNENKMLICVGLGACVNLIGNAILIPKLYEYGATLATITSEIVVMILYVCISRGYYKLIGMQNTIVKVTISGFIMAFFLFLCNSVVAYGWYRLVIQVVGAAFIYVVILIILKEDIILYYYNAVARKLIKW